MLVCNCPVREKPLSAAGLVDAVSQGCSTLREVVKKTGAGTNCGSCGPTLGRLSPVIKDLASERDATNNAAPCSAAEKPCWPTSDQFERAKQVVNKTVLSR